VASVSSTRAQDLVYTSNYVEGDMSVGDVKAWFQAQISVVSLGVITHGETFGLITRNHLSQQLIGQIQKPAFLKQPISDIMITTPLVVESGLDLDSVVMRLFTEKSRDEEFFHDIIVKEGGHFVGLISIRDLLVNHFENLTHKLTAMEAQLQSLAQKNKELFANSFRVGHQEGQLKQILEAIPVPIALFADDGKLAHCNPRFLELLEYTPKTLELGTRFKELFDESFGGIYQQAVRNWEEAIHDDEARYVDLTARTRSGDPVRTGTYFELMPDGRHVCLTLVSLQEKPAPVASSSSAPAADITPVETPTRPMGKVTQAIRLKLSNENAMGLARTVATNLIDRDDSIDKLMKKVEAIIKVSDQIERSDALPSPVASSLASALTNPVERPPLRGNLADFSLIDLCQILVQGTKTGHLRLQLVNGISGDVFFYCGSIVHAATDHGHQGIQALPALMTGSNGSFEFNFDVASPSNTIQGDAIGILMDACRLADESVR
jgi:PAS domain-containing protein